MNDNTEVSKVNVDLANTINMFFEPGYPSDFGWPVNELGSAIEVCASISNKPYCAVKDWVWWDIGCDEQSLSLIKELNVQPCLIKSNYVVTDELHRFDTGSWVRSGLLKHFHHNAIFETSNNFYILLGQGTRKSVDISTVKLFS